MTRWIATPSLATAALRTVMALTFLSSYHLRREPVETDSPQNAADGCRRNVRLDGDLFAGVALAAQSLDHRTCDGRRLARQSKRS